jgi:protein NrfD
MQVTEVVKHISHAQQANHHLWWEWQIPVYLFLGGIVAGLMVLTAWRALKTTKEERSDTFRLLSWFAPILISAGMGALFLDLAAKLNVFRFYMAFKPLSPMSWGAWILLIVYPVSILFAVSELPKKWRDKLSKGFIGKIMTSLTNFVDQESTKKALAWTSIFTGIALGVYTGVLLSNLVARPLWNSTVLGPLFLISGLSTGAAFMLLFKLNNEERHTLGKIDMGLIGIELLLIGLFIISLFNGTAMQQEAGALLAANEFAAAFWSLVVIAGLIAPLLIDIFEIKRKLNWTAVPAVLVLVGGLALRWILVQAGQISSW